MLYNDDGAGRRTAASFTLLERQELLILFDPPARLARDYIPTGCRQQHPQANDSVDVPLITKSTFPPLRVPMQPIITIAMCDLSQTYDDRASTSQTLLWIEIVYASDILQIKGHS